MLSLLLLLTLCVWRSHTFTGHSVCWNRTSMEHWMWKLANQFFSSHVCLMLISSGVASMSIIILLRHIISIIHHWTVFISTSGWTWPDLSDVKSWPVIWLWWWCELVLFCSWVSTVSAILKCYATVFPKKWGTAQSLLRNSLTLASSCPMRAVHPNQQAGHMSIVVAVVNA